MKHDDNTIQAAIDAAMLEIKTGTQHKSLDTYVSNYWHKESPARLALAKAFLAKLPEPQPILADDGRSLEQVAIQEHEKAPSGIKWFAAANAVATVAITRAVQRIEAVTEKELYDQYWKGQTYVGSSQAIERIRARLIAAVKGEAVGINGLTEAKVEKAEANLREVRKHLEDANRGAERNAHINRSLASQLIEARKQIEKAEAELASLKSSQLGILRPMAEAGPVPDGCVRVTALKGHKDDWAIGDSQSQHDTHFADIRLPVTDTPAIEAADPHARLKAYAKAGARIRLNKGTWRIHSFFAWTDFAENYEVHPDDLHLVPEYDPVNEQPKQQVPLGPEQKLQAIKDILESK